jgi:O-ureido-D-serine cyclo-ligase
VPPLRVAIVTAAIARDLDEDLAPLSDALSAIDVEHTIVDWDDAGVDWRAFGLAVVRSTWDYVPRHEEFLAWAARASAATTLLNPEPVLRWNSDKRYLRDLTAAGVAVTPTRWFEPGDSVAADAVAPDDGEFVVKPAVSAGSKDTARYRPSERGPAVEHVEGLLAEGRVVMVQPYLAAIDHAGETAAVYIDGAFSHGLRKGAILRLGDVLVDGLYAEEDMAPREPTPAEMDLAAATMAAIPAILGPGAGDRPLLYGRVDMVPGPDGAPVVLELELTEPSLFHAHAPGSAARLASAIAARLPH